MDESEKSEFKIHTEVVKSNIDFAHLGIIKYPCIISPRKDEDSRKRRIEIHELISETAHRDIIKTLIDRAEEKERNEQSL